MVLPAFNAKRLKERLVQLDKKQQLAFGAVCCERLLPNYVAFQQDSGFGNSASLREALNFVWAFLGGQSPSASEIEEVTITCESVAPNSEDSSSLYVTAAQDVCFAICSLLDFMREYNPEKIVQVATYATDSVDLYVQETESLAPSDPDIEERILTHRLMQRELRQQNADLEVIESNRSLSQDFLIELKSSWNNDGRSNLDLP
jgi:uncharacterized protein